MKYTDGEVLVLKAECISVKNNQQNILSNINFSIKSNQILGVLGTNGAGKSTLLKLCADILIPSNGLISRKVEPNEIGYLPEQAPLIHNISTYNYLRHLAELRNIPNINKKISEVINICQLGEVKNKLIKFLSKGNQQRIGIAQSILHSPKLLILDEPTSGLDPKQIVNFRDLLLNLKPQCSIIFSTHIMQEVESICDRAIVLNGGKLIADIDIINQNLFKIIFKKSLDRQIVKHIPNWIKGEGKVHFFSESEQAKTITLEYCLLHKLDIDIISNKTNELSEHLMR